MISSKANPDLLIITWKDPQEDETGWKEFKHSHIGLANCISIGWVIDENDEYWVLAADLIIEKGKITDTGRRQSVYKSDDKISQAKRIKYNIYDKEMETPKAYQLKN